MPLTSEEIIKQFGGALVDDIKAAIPTATGKTADSVKIRFTKTGFIITGSQAIDAIINGRKPTKAGAKKGNPTLQKSILEWIRAKGITPRNSGMSIVQLSWAMSKSIHLNGYKGRGNIFKDVITKQRINSLTKTLISNKALSIESDIVKSIQV